MVLTLALSNNQRLQKMKKKQFKSIRLRIGLSQDQLANLLGMHRVHISRIETGELKEIRKTTELSMRYILSEFKKKNKGNENER